MNKWLLSDTLQIAPQEAEQSNYLVGQIDSAVDRSGPEPVRRPLSRV